MGNPPTGSLWEFERKALHHPCAWLSKFQVTFILTTDGRKTAIGAILLQIQEEEERPPGLCQPSTKYSWIALFNSEIELLALLWATKYFRCYLLGAKFFVKTDHASLTYLRNFADHNSRLLRWSLRLQDYKSFNDCFIVLRQSLTAL